MFDISLLLLQWITDWWIWCLPLIRAFDPNYLSFFVPVSGIKTSHACVAFQPSVPEGPVPVPESPDHSSKHKHDKESRRVLVDSEDQVAAPPVAGLWTVLPQADISFPDNSAGYMAAGRHSLKRTHSSYNKHDWFGQIQLLRHRDFFLTHWGQNKMAALLQMAFPKSFWWMKSIMCLFKSHWHSFLRNNKPTVV